MYYLAFYDIPSAKRLKKAARLCEQTGLHRIQKSVFLGKLSLKQAEIFRENALKWLSSKEDKLLMIPVSRDDLSACMNLGVDCGVMDVIQKPAVLFL